MRAEAAHDSPLYDYPPDTGCSIAPKCVECPLPRCRYESGKKSGALILRDVEMLQLARQGATHEQIARHYSVSTRTVFNGLARARLHQPEVELPRGDAARQPVLRSVEVPVVRLHIRPSPKPKHRTVIRSRDWHDRLVILRAWGYSLSMIGYAADRIDHSTVIHHLKEQCQCGKPRGYRGFQRRLDASREEAA